MHDLPWRSSTWPWPPPFESADRRPLRAPRSSSADIRPRSRTRPRRIGPAPGWFIHTHEINSSEKRHVRPRKCKVSHSEKVPTKPCPFAGAYLHRLKVGDRLSKLLALVQKRHGRVERALREANHLRGNADATLVQQLDGDLVALADLAEYLEAEQSVRRGSLKGLRNTMNIGSEVNAQQSASQSKHTIRLRHVR